MHNFTPYASFVGGALIGLSASLFLLTTGRIAGISGIFAGLIHRQANDTAWRFAFVVGLIGTGVAASVLMPTLFDSSPSRNILLTVMGGLLVGFGTRMGNGCTSGHGICGLSRFSVRSLVSVVTFMTTAAVTVYVVNHFLGSV
jgi:uncharacterized membrane protein YedE/YeeE